MSRWKRKKKDHHPPFDEPVPNDDTNGSETNVHLNVKPISKLETRFIKIFQRAIASAQKHDIYLEPGTINQGHGDCSYESVIYNINERSCFTEKLPMGSAYYRRIWTTDMLNKLLDNRIPRNPDFPEHNY